MGHKYALTLWICIELPTTYCINFLLPVICAKYCNIIQWNTLFQKKNLHWFGNQGVNILCAKKLCGFVHGYNEIKVKDLQTFVMTSDTCYLFFKRFSLLCSGITKRIQSSAVGQEFWIYFPCRASFCILFAIWNTICLTRLLSW